MPIEHKFANAARYAALDAGQKRKKAVAKPKPKPAPKATPSTTSRWSHLQGLTIQDPAEADPLATAPADEPERKEAGRLARAVVRASRKGVR